MFNWLRKVNCVAWALESIFLLGCLVGLGYYGDAGGVPLFFKSMAETSLFKQNDNIRPPL